MGILRVRNLLDQSAQYTFISQSQSAGVSTIPVKNISSFQASWAIQIGKTGEELAEIKLLGTATPSGTALLTTANTTYAHSPDTPVYAIKFDQLVFERSTAGTAGTATPMTNGTVTITPDSDYTIFDDTTGASTYAYKTYYQNSVTLAQTSESDWMVPSGFTFYSLAKLRERTKRKLFSFNYIQDDSVIDDWINEWLEQMNSAAVKVNQEYSIGTTTVSFGTSGLGTITASDYKDLYRLWLTYDNVNNYMASRIKLNSIYPDDTFNQTHPYYGWQGDKVLQIYPASSCTATILYYQVVAPLVNDTDEIPSPMHSYTNSFVNYALANAYYKDDKKALGDTQMTLAIGGKKDFIDSITPRSYTGAQSISFVEALNADDGTFEIR